jgi:hypothetical protein
VLPLHFFAYIVAGSLLSPIVLGAQARKKKKGQSHCNQPRDARRMFAAKIHSDLPASEIISSLN